MTDGAEHPAVESLELLERAFGYRPAGELVRATSDRHRLPVDLQCCARGRGFHHLDAFGDDFETDVVAFEYAYLQGSFHRALYLLVCRSRASLACEARHFSRTGGGIMMKK